MIRAVNANGFKLAALDLDGTLLGPDHQISAANARAVRQLQAAGAHVVLASGRHFNTMRQYAAALPGVEWIVSFQGGETSDVRRQNVLGRAFLPAAQARQALELANSLDCTPVVYTVDGVLTNVPWNAELDFYASLAGHRPVTLPTAEVLAHDVFKVIWMAAPDVLSGVAPSLTVLPSSVQVVRTHKRILEFMPADVTKASALATLAASLGVHPSEAVVFGDGDNDIPMFDWAGTSVAMPHGWPAALRRASHVAPRGPADSALARGVEMVLGISA